jgi:hypothetical protein
MAGTASVLAVNLFSLRDGVSVRDFARFSAAEDRPACLATPIVTSFDVYHVIEDCGGAPRIMEIMGLTSYEEWNQALGTVPALQPVVRRFAELVDTATVSTLIVTPVDDGPEIAQEGS